MVKVEIYTKPGCPYCFRAMHILKSKGVEYTEYDIIADPAKEEEMLERSNGMRTIPEIFINGKHIGGFDNLHALESEGKLDELLGKE